MDLGKRIRKARKVKKLTQEQLGKAANVSDATINRYENGIRQPDPEMLILLADILDVSVDYLLGRTDTPRLKAETDKIGYSELFTQKDEGQAYILAAELRYKHKLSDETFLKIIDEVGRFYNRDQKPLEGDIAAHGPDIPGTGSFTIEELENYKKPGNDKDK